MLWNVQEIISSNDIGSRCHYYGHIDITHIRRNRPNRIKGIAVIPLIVTVTGITHIPVVVTVAGITLVTEK